MTTHVKVEAHPGNENVTQVTITIDGQKARAPEHLRDGQTSDFPVPPGAILSIREIPDPAYVQAKAKAAEDNQGSPDADQKKEVAPDMGTVEPKAAP